MHDIDKQKLKDIVASLMIVPDEEVMNKLMSEWKSLQEDLASLENIDLENVKPLSHINEKLYIDFLRDDEENTADSINKNDILKNAPTKNEDFITMNKVVK